MRLTRLDIKGFKSFADETVINFGENIIGIVGPNGSGKSNIVDAIRWVLGEQKSRELRLDKMASVIFNGTKKRRPSGLAQVALTFENTKNLLPTEYNNVTITRKLYASGESEYLLNNVPCRLKDITNLFLDTGIGSNSYAIIALGMVDDILQDKEQARRRMFEQAAGISKYKTRKRETINKLRSTEADLERIEDLLFEIENNLKELEKQARRARRYFELKEKYKSLAVELAAYQLSRHKEQYLSVQERIKAAEDDKRALEIKSHQQEALLEQEKKANIDKEKALTERQRTLNQIVNQTRNDENERNLLREKLRFLQQSESQLIAQIEEAGNKEKALQGEISHFQNALQQEKALEQQLQEELNASNTQVEEIRQSHTNLKGELEQYLTVQQNLDREMLEFEKRKAIFASQTESYQKDLERLERQKIQQEEDISLLEKERQLVEAQRKNLQKKLAQLQQSEEQRMRKTEALEEEIEEVRLKIQAVNRELDARRNEYKLTESMIENLEGFPESIKFLNKSGQWIDNPPLLSDLIYCKEEYRVAIENYLEPYLNYYVVPTFEDAKKGILLLSQAQKGKANFFVLEAFRNYELPIHLLPETTRALDLVETDPPYEKLIQYLLEDVLVTDQEELPRQLEKADVTLLSRNGRFIKRRFSISGGSVGLFEGKKLGRKKNLEVLKTTIEKKERQEQRLSNKFYDLKTQLETLKKEVQKEALEQLNQELNQLDQRKISVLTRLENFDQAKRDAARQTEEILQATQEIVNRNNELEKQLEDKTRAAQTSKESVSQTDQSYKRIADQLAEANAIHNQKQIEFIRHQNKVQSLEKELAFRQNQQAEQRELSANSRKKLEENKQAQTEGAEKLQVLEQKLLASYDAQKEREASLTEAEQEYFKTRGQINELEDQLRQFNKQVNDQQTLISNLKDKFNEVKLSMSGITERMRIEFSVSSDELLKMSPDEEQVPEGLEEKVQRLKNRIENYGEINPMAVQAFDEMKLRYDSISEQRQDILEAKASLIETIEEIETTATQQFMEAFDQVRAYFQQVFRSLFTENDSCDLLLLEPENPLESQIEITAKPKGKRPQTINQLSGGEKTLTATALLFALYLLKPAPFCIFDEVDAPLDDANIEKFNKIVKEFSKDSQFIIVTHNKATMTAVDVIYGVYMQEQGVSNVSPVDFRSLKHTSLLESV